MTTVITPPVCEVHLWHSPRPLRIVPHHIQPLGMGGPDVPANVVHVCDTGHFNIHRLIDDLLTDGTMRRAGTRKEHALAQQGYDAWVAAGKPGRPVYELIPETPGAGRLGRHREHDPRSRAFAVTPTPAPKSVLWHRHVKPFDQGQIGSCTGNAMAGALSTAPFRHRFGEATAVTLYKAATIIDGIPGAYPPNDTGSSGLAVAKAAQARKWITSYAHCFSFDAVLTALQSGPCIAGTNWHAGMDTPDPDGLVHVSGPVRGGHEYELVGCDVERERILAVNSWGTSWGRAGFFDIGFADFQRLLAEQGDVTTFS